LNLGSQSSASRSRRAGRSDVIGCTLSEAFTLLSGRGVLATNRQPAKKNASQPDALSELEGAETAW
jgi:hypothetical protein